MPKLTKRAVPYGRKNLPTLIIEKIHFKKYIGNTFVKHI